MRVLLRKLIRDLDRRRLRNSLTLIGVVLGVAGVVAIATTSRNLADAQRLTYDSQSQADLVNFTSDLSPTVRDLVSRQDNVRAADSRSVVTTRFSVGNGWENVRINGIEDFRQMRLDVPELSRGRFPTRGEIVFDESARQLASIEIGDVVAVQRSAADQPEYFTISGFTRSPAVIGAGILNRAVAYATAHDVRTMTGLTADNYLLVRVRDQDRASQTAADLTQLLEKRGVAAGAFVVRDPDQFVGSRELGTLLFLLHVFSVGGAILAGFIVANTLLAIMSEEARQIGVVKSLGGTSLHIAGLYLIYSGILGLAGALGGLVLGLTIGRVSSAYLTSLTGLQQPPFVLSPSDVLLAVLIGAVVTIVATLAPAFVNSAGWPAELLRAPGIHGDYRPRLMRRVTTRLSNVSTALTSGIRNAVRRPVRAGLTIAVVAVAVAAFVSTQALSASVNGTVDDLYDLYGADGWIFFRGGADLILARELASNPNVLEAEPWTSASGAIGSTRTDIWGMPDHDPIYNYRLLAGTWFQRSTPVSVVLTSNLAAEVDARVGDILELDVGAVRETVHVVGIVNDSSTYLGNTATGKVFMPVEDINRITGRGERADVFALRLHSSHPSFVDETLASLEQKYASLAPGSLAAHEDQEAARETIRILTLLLSAMVIIVGIVGIAGIVNTLLINVTERRRELGILRSIGAGTRDIVAMFVTEGLATAILGLIAGLFVGLPLAYLLVDLTGRQLFELSFYLSLPTLSIGFIVTLTAVAAASTIPGIIAGRINPVTVLRYE